MYDLIWPRVINKLYLHHLIAQLLDLLETSFKVRTGKDTFIDKYSVLLVGKELRELIDLMNGHGLIQSARHHQI